MPDPLLVVGTYRQREVSRASLMLVLVTMFWGMSFPFMKDWQVAAVNCPGAEPLSSFTLIAFRMILGLVFLLLWQPHLLVGASRREILAGAAVGSTFFVGFSFQVSGIAFTTPASSAFLTSMASAWTTVLSFFLFRDSIPFRTWAGLLLGIVGIAILCEMDQNPTSPGMGEILTLAASLFFAGQILLVDWLGSKIRPAFLTSSFLGVTGILAATGALTCAGLGPGLKPWLLWTGSMVRSPDNAKALLILSFFSTVLAFHWMNQYQPTIPASRAALIYLLEPIFAALFSVAWSREKFGVRLFLGGFFILGGNLLVEVSLRWKERKKRELAACKND